MENKKHLSYYHYKVFTESIFKGSSVGIIINSKGVTEEEKQKLAKVLNLESLAFVYVKSSNNYDIEFFIPSKKVEICDHGLLGTAIALVDHGKVLNQSDTDLESLRFFTEKKKHIVRIKINESKLNVAYLDYFAPEFKPINFKTDQLTQSLNLANSNVNNKEKLKITYTGLNHLYIECKNIKIVKDVEPNFNKLMTFMRENDIDSVSIFTFETENKDNFIHVREFTPLLGKNEQLASATTNSGLLYYLNSLKRLSIENIEDNLVIEQGYNKNSPSDIGAEIIIKNNEIHNIRIKANAVCFIRGVINL